MKARPEIVRRELHGIAVETNEYMIMSVDDAGRVTGVAAEGHLTSLLKMLSTRGTSEETRAAAIRHLSQFDQLQTAVSRAGATPVGLTKASAQGVDLRDAEGNPIPWESKDFPNGCYLHDGLYTNPEPRYRKQELQAVGPFDVALTFEPFGNKGISWDRRILIVSRRFREFCLQHGWKSDWVPVRIDED